MGTRRGHRYIERLCARCSCGKFRPRFPAGDRTRGHCRWSGEAAHIDRDALQHYYLKRTEVLDYLLENTPGGYRTKDATFAKAKVFWESADPMNPGTWQNAKRAVDLWRSIDHLSDAGDFVAGEAHTAMREALQKFKAFASPETTQIRIALDKETFKIMQKKTERENRILWSSKKSATAGK